MGAFYGWKYRARGASALAAVAVCWLTAAGVVGWSMAAINDHVLAQGIKDAGLLLTGGGFAGWLVGYGIRARQASSSELSRQQS